MTESDGTVNTFKLIKNKNYLIGKYFTCLHINILASKCKEEDN